MPEDMGAEEQADLSLPIWSCEDFLKRRKAFNDANKTEESALAILQELVEIQDDQVDINAWIECSTLLELLLKSVAPSTLLTKHQIWCITALRDKSHNVVKILAQILTNGNDVTKLLSTEATAVAIAFARRINHTDTYEAIAKLLAPVSCNPDVLNELKHQHDTSNSMQHRFKVYQVVVEALQQEVYHDGLNHFMDAIEELLKGDDYIGKLCALEMLTEAAVYNKSSSDVLSNLSITKKVYEVYALKNTDSDLFHASMVYLAALCRNQPALLLKFDKLPPIIFEKLTTSDMVDDLAFMVDSLQHIAVSPAGKLNLMTALGADTIGCLLKTMFARNYFKAVEVLRDRVVAFFGSIFKDDNDASSADWFALVGPELCSLLTTSLAKSTERERRHAMETLDVLLRKTWAVKEFMNMNKKNLDIFMEWVSEYSDPVYEHTQKKKDILSQFVTSNVCAELVEPGVKQRIEDSLKAPVSREPLVETVNL